MVQLKYFGDDRDYFKYDLITHVLASVGFRSYGFVPMLTEHREDNEGNWTPRSLPCKSDRLLGFIRECESHDLDHWRRWITPHVQTYLTADPVNETFFRTSNRAAYWQRFADTINAPGALVFFDPDTGLQAGRKTRIHPTEFDKYILDEEIANLYANLDGSSTFMIYQHLQRNRKMHTDDIERKMRSIRALCPEALVQVYKESDLAFVFLSRRTENAERVGEALSAYYNRSTVPTKGLYV
jgi:hypothetical protein